MTTETYILPTVDPIDLIENDFLIVPNNDLPKNDGNYESCEEDDVESTKHLKTYSDDVKYELLTYSNTLDSIKGHDK